VEGERDMGTADVVVIGGGILGCCAAHFLHRAGVRRIVLVERAPELGRQTSWAAAGFISLWATEADPTLPPDDTSLELALEQESLRFYRALGAEHDIGLRTPGLVQVAISPQTALMQARQHQRAKAMVRPDEMLALSPEEVASVSPVVEPSQVLHGLFFPTAIHLTGDRTVAALGRELAAAGVVLQTDTALTAMEVTAGRVSGVHTTHGAIATDTVVNASGAWLPQTAAMVGLDLPIVAELAARFVTPPLPDLPADLPMTCFREYFDLFMRGDEGRLLAGTNYGDASSTRQDYGDPPADVAELPSRVAHFAHDKGRAFAATVPVLGRVEIAEARSGLIAYTPDNRHYLGEAAAVAGYYVLAGDSGGGISHGPGLGRLLSELMVQGRASRDISSYRLDRFSHTGGGRGEKRKTSDTAKRSMR